MLLTRRGDKPLTGKFLHLTDIHLDPYYVEGSDPGKLCHRKNKKKKKNTAGKYGALSTDCDSPIPLVDASFAFMKNQLQDIDFIIYTGDTARHDRDDDLPRTDKDVLDEHKMVINYFQKAYDMSTIPLVPTIGNNDMFEHNDVSTKDKIYKKLKEIWQPLHLNLNDNFQTDGYFTQDVVPGLQIINTNSMYFYKKNSDVEDCDNSNSPGAKQLKWMKQSLEKAKKEKKRVYVMGHIPPNDDDDSLLFRSECHEQYYKLIGQYGSIIAGHFTGHTNNDMLTAVVENGKSFKHISALDDGDNLKDHKIGKVATMLFNAPSLIPVNNPAIRVYHYATSNSKNASLGTILDWEQYYVDLEKANKKGRVKFELEYQASKIYNINKFDATGISTVFKTLQVNEKIRKLYGQFVTVSD
ncbi:Metallo-dependent phosphatase-like protein [Cunninghamella echinulata]|nr:Metallo-dependent phosphatase-like protein [Cunninghamella echinulata]